MLKVERKSRIGSMEITQMVEVDSLTKDEEIAYLKRILSIDLTLEHENEE